VKKEFSVSEPEPVKQQLFAVAGAEIFSLASALVM
jgi:hypothetical protein